MPRKKPRPAARKQRALLKARVEPVAPGNAKKRRDRLPEPPGIAGPGLGLAMAAAMIGNIGRKGPFT